MADENKSLLGLLNGLARQDFYNESEITDHFLQSELYANIPDHEFKTLIQKTRGIVRSMASMDMDLSQLETFLSSQMKKKDSGLTESQAKVYMKFWKTHRSRIHESLVAKTKWNNNLKSMSWRIDVKTKSRSVDQLNVPTAIVELQIADPQSKDQETDVVRFEMDETSISKVLGNLKDIEEQIEKHCKTS